MREYINRTQNNNYANIENHEYYKNNKLNIERLKNMRNITSVKDFGLDEKQLINLLIKPLKCEKIDRGEFENKCNDLNQQYLPICVKSTANSQILIPRTVQKWYESRTNMPYKNVLKHLNINDDYMMKSFNKKDDLIVHKTTKLDKFNDIATLDNELKNIKNIIKSHNEELENIYNIANETKYLKDFEYVNKQKYKIKYDPKDSTDLRKYYNKEQKKIKINEKRIDDLIELLLDNDNLTKDELVILENAQKDISDDENENIGVELDCEPEYDCELKIKNQIKNTIHETISKSDDLKNKYINRIKKGKESDKKIKIIMQKIE